MFNTDTVTSLEKPRKSKNERVRVEPDSPTLLAAAHDLELPGFHKALRLVQNVGDYPRQQIILKSKIDRKTLELLDMEKQKYADSMIMRTVLETHIYKRRARAPNIKHTHVRVYKMGDNMFHSVEGSGEDDFGLIDAYDLKDSRRTAYDLVTGNKLRSFVEVTFRHGNMLMAKTNGRQFMFYNTESKVFSGPSYNDDDANPQSDCAFVEYVSQKMIDEQGPNSYALILNRILRTDAFSPYVSVRKDSNDEPCESENEKCILELLCTRVIPSPWCMSRDGTHFRANRLGLYIEIVIARPSWKRQDGSQYSIYRRFRKSPKENITCIEYCSDTGTINFWGYTNTRATRYQCKLNQLDDYMVNLALKSTWMPLEIRNKIRTYITDL